MKKFLLLVSLLFMYTGVVLAQNVLYQDNLDSYSDNSYMGQNLPAWWTTWSTTYQTGLDLQVKTTYSHSSPNSALADKVGGTTDCILKLGNKVSGAYELKWWMYIPSGKCAYYNVQHMEAPGTEWAFEIYFRTGGTSTGKMILQVAGDTTMYNYPKATWFEVKHQIDLDKDSIWLYINNNFIMKWKFSDQASNPGGTNQLGGVDFYAGAYGSTAESPTFYIDDVSFIETIVATFPIISATPASVFQNVLLGTMGTSNLQLNNTGTANLNYNVNVVYNIANKKSTQVITETANVQEVKRVLTKTGSNPANDGSPNATDATAILHYDGDPNNAIGWSTLPVNVTVAARFPNALTLPYAGLKINSVDVFINALNAGGAANNLMKVIIFGMGNTYMPGDTLLQQEFTPADTGWVNIALTNPLTVDGQDLWVGYNFTQVTASIYIPGVDGGPADPNGDFESTGIGWGHLAPTLDYNWNIRANLSGALISQWLSVSPGSGTIAPGANQTLTLNFNTQNLALGQYSATIKLLSNDPVTPVLDIPVTMTVIAAGSCSIAGYVRDGSSNPISGVTVTFTNITPGTTTTNTQGYYSFSVPNNYSGTATPSKMNLSFTPSSRNYTNVITNLTGQDYLGSATSNHFIPVWTGNPLYPMNIAVTQATIDQVNLGTNDEIGVFDGNICVGACKLSASINPTNPQFITLSKDDPATPAVDGYTEGNTIIYKLWKSSNSLEVSNVTHTFPYAPSFAFETFIQGETSVVALAGTSMITLNRPLLAGWNMISFNVLPPDMNMLSILQPLVTSGVLIKVIDEAGRIIQYFPWGWVNNIGNMAITEGYYIKVASSCTISTTGALITSPTTIPLLTGWNIIGYPGQTSQNALTALQPLITSGLLIKVIDEAGNIIQYFPWGWVNNIGNLAPGKGYYIKVSASCSLTVTNLKEALDEKIACSQPTHFVLPVHGNPYRPMAIGLSLNPLALKSFQPGNEIGIFDGDLCVGAFLYENSSVQHVLITAFADDPETKDKEGFIEGNQIMCKVWDPNKAKEILIDLNYLDGDKYFTQLGTYLGEIQNTDFEVTDGNADLAFLGNNHPNPFSGETIIEYKIYEPCQVTLTIISSEGRKILELLNSRHQPGNYLVKVDASKVPPGMYFYRMEAYGEGSRFYDAHKMFIIK